MEMSNPDWLKGIPPLWFEEIKLAFISGYHASAHMASTLSAEECFELHVEGRALDAVKQKHNDKSYK